MSLTGFDVMAVTFEASRGERTGTTRRVQLVAPEGKTILSVYIPQELVSGYYVSSMLPVGRQGRTWSVVLCNSREDSENAQITFHLNVADFTPPGPPASPGRNAP